jgi:hypothetical protein
MKKLFFAGLLTLLLLPAMGTAQNPFDGTWKFDMSTAKFPRKPDSYLLQNGMFECKNPPCEVAYKVKADGTDQKVTGIPYYDTVSVKAVDDHNVETTEKQNGKVVGTAKRSVSADGNTMTVNWTYSGNPAGGTQAGTDTFKRVEKAPAGANMISGSWRAEKSEAPAAVLTWTYKVNNDEITMTTPTGQSFTAKLDGTDAPYKGDPGTTSVSMKMHGKDTLEEIDKRDGKVIGVGKMTVAPDGKTAKLEFEDKLRGTTMTGEAQKQ